MENNISNIKNSFGEICWVTANKLLLLLSYLFLLICVIFLLFLQVNSFKKEIQQSPSFEYFHDSSKYLKYYNQPPHRKTCSNDLDCEGENICDMGQNPRVCVTGGDLSRLKNSEFRMKSNELLKCFCGKKMLVVGDSTSRSMWAQILQLLTGKLSSEWRHEYMNVTKKLTSCPIESLNSNFTLHSIYFPPLPFETRGTLFERPFKSEYEVMNYLDYIWNSANENEKINENDYILVGGVSDSWISDIEQWLHFKLKQIEQIQSSSSSSDENFYKKVIATSYFELVSNTSCHITNNKGQSSFCAKNLSDCQSLCLNSKFECIGVSFCESPRGDCSCQSNNSNTDDDNNTTNTTNNCLVYHTSGVITTAPYDSIHSCYSYHDLELANKSLLWSKSNPITKKLNIFIRSNSPNKWFPLDQQKLIWKETKLKIIELQKTFPTINFQYFDIWNRLINRLDDFRDNLHFHFDHPQKSGVYGELNYEITNDFISLLCGVHNKYEN